MKVQLNFDIREFVPESIWEKFGKNSTWFINPVIPSLAQFYKNYFTEYYKNKFPGRVKTVLIKVNTWHYEKGGFQNRGLRIPSSKVGAKLSQHRFKDAFDCEIIVVFLDGKKEEVSYKEIHEIIMANDALFRSQGLTTIESVNLAPGWLHSDVRFILDQKKIMVF